MYRFSNGSPENPGFEVECCRGCDPNITGSQGLEGKMSIFSNYLGCGGTCKGFLGKSAGGRRRRPFPKKEVDPRNSVAPSMVGNSERDEPVGKRIEEAAIRRGARFPWNPEERRPLSFLRCADTDWIRLGIEQGGKLSLLECESRAPQ